MKKYKEFNESKKAKSTYVQDLSKIKNIIKSCKTNKQTESADNALELWKKKWKEELASQDVHELNRMIQDKF